MARKFLITLGIYRYWYGPYKEVKLTEADKKARITTRVVHKSSVLVPVQVFPETSNEHWTHIRFLEKLPDRPRLQNMSVPQNDVKRKKEVTL